MTLNTAKRIRYKKQGIKNKYRTFLTFNFSPCFNAPPYTNRNILGTSPRRMETFTTQEK